jgi:hypothetical protein
MIYGDYPDRDPIRLWVENWRKEREARMMYPDMYFTTFDDAKAEQDRRFASRSPITGLERAFAVARDEFEGDGQSHSLEDAGMPESQWYEHDGHRYPYRVRTFSVAPTGLNLSAAQLFINLLSEFPPDKVIFRPLDHSQGYSGQQMIEELANGSLIAQEYASSLLRVCRDLLARQAAK